jgi:hypothetical protein
MRKSKFLNNLILRGSVMVKTFLKGKPAINASSNGQTSQRQSQCIASPDRVSLTLLASQINIKLLLNFTPPSRVTQDNKESSRLQVIYQFSVSLV